MMDIVSCETCGVVLDKDRLNFHRPEDVYHDDGGINGARAAWDGEAYTPFVGCPVCSSPIFNGIKL